MVPHPSPHRGTHRPLPHNATRPQIRLIDEPDAGGWFWMLTVLVPDVGFEILFHGSMPTEQKARRDARDSCAVYGLDPSTVEEIADRHP
jgi:hypothetical protein